MVCFPKRLIVCAGLAAVVFAAPFVGCVVWFDSRSVWQETALGVRAHRAAGAAFVPGASTQKTSATSLRTNA